MAKTNPPEPPAQDNLQPTRAASLQGFLNREAENEDGTPKDRLGRKPSPINWDKVETAMAMGGDLKECAAHGGVHYNTLERRVLERYGDGFKEVRAYFMTDLKAGIRRAFMKKIKNGDTLCILAGMRAYNGMDDKPKAEAPDDNHDDGSTFKLAYDPHKKPASIEAKFTTKETK